MVGTPRGPSEGSAAPLLTLRKSLWFLLLWSLPDRNGKSTDPKTGQSVHKLSLRTYNQDIVKEAPVGERWIRVRWKSNTPGWLSPGISFPILAMTIKTETVRDTQSLSERHVCLSTRQGEDMGQSGPGRSYKSETHRGGFRGTFQVEGGRSGLCFTKQQSFWIP